MLSNFNFTKSFIKTFKLFLVNSSLGGLALLVFLKSYKAQRVLWTIVIICIISTSIYFVMFSWAGFMENPTITTLESTEHPIWKVDFPAIGICSANKMSRKAVTLYARKLLSKMKYQPMNVTQLEEKIKLLAALFDSSGFSEDEASNFQENILDKYDADPITGFYNVREVLEELAPKCEDILNKCMWEGQLKNCTDLFKLEVTASGFCCVFNRRRTSSSSSLNKTGHENGLTLLVNTSTNDYFYNDRSSLGLVVQLFNNENFPDGTTGNLQEFFLGNLEDIYMKILVTTLRSTEHIKQYSVERRKCYFADEKTKDFVAKYTYAECLTKCKLRSVNALCSCTPYYATLEKNDNTYCSLTHISCLKRYRATWNTYRPHEEGIEGLEREMEDSLSCPDCLPACSNTAYNFHKTSSDINPKTVKMIGILSGEKTLNDTSILRIYYDKTGTMLFKKDVVYHWYEIVANFGGLLGICMSCSIVSFIEILYFFCIKYFDVLTRQDYQDDRSSLVATGSTFTAFKNKFKLKKKTLNSTTNSKNELYID